MGYGSQATCQKKILKNQFSDQAQVSFVLISMFLAYVRVRTPYIILPITMSFQTKRSFFENCELTLQSISHLHLHLDKSFDILTISYIRL